MEDSRRTIAIVLGIALLFGVAFAVLASRAFRVTRDRSPPLPIDLDVHGDLGPTISTRPIEAVPGGPPIPPLRITVPSEFNGEAMFVPAPAPVVRVWPPRPVPTGPAVPPSARRRRGGA